jgi:heptosyltransferase-2
MKANGARSGEKSGLVVIRGALGDTLLALPLLRALPGHFRVDSLSMVGAPGPLSLLATLPFVSSVHDHDRAVWAGLYSDAPEADPRLVEFVSNHTAAAVVAKNEPDPAARGLKRLGLREVSTVPAAPPVGRRVHVSDYMFERTGIAPPVGTCLMEASAEGRAAAGRFLAESNIAPGSFALFQPGSGGQAKNWPLDRWRETARGVRKALGLRPVFLLGPAEKAQAEALSTLEPAERPLLATGLSLVAAAGLIESAALFAGHDSGVTHLAAVMGRPTLAVFGPTDPVRYAPRGPAVEILAPPNHPQDSWDWLTPDQVVGKLSQFRVRHSFLHFWRKM